MRPLQWNDSSVTNDSQIESPSVATSQPQQLRIAMIVTIGYSGALLLVGFVGNLYCLVTNAHQCWLHRKRGTQARRVMSLRRNAIASVSRYLVGIAFADIMTLITFLESWLTHLPGLSLNIVKSSSGCAIITYIGFTGSALCPWLIVALTVERFLVVKNPFRSHTAVSSSRTTRILLLIGLGAYVYNAPYLTCFSLLQVARDPERLICAPIRRFHSLIAGYEIANLILVFTLPLAIVFATNIQMITLLTQSLKRPKRTNCQPNVSFTKYSDSEHNKTRIAMMSRNRKASVSSLGEIRRLRRSSSLPDILKDVSSVHLGLPRGKSRYSSDNTSTRLIEKERATRKNAIKRLVLVSLLYLMLNLPAYTLRLIHYLSPTWNGISLVGRKIIYLIFTTQYSLHCFTYSKIKSSLQSRKPSMLESQSIFVEHKIRPDGCAAPCVTIKTPKSEFPTTAYEPMQSACEKQTLWQPQIRVSIKYELKAVSSCSFA